MRFAILLALMFSFLPAPVFSAETQSYRNEARSAADRLRKIFPPAPLNEEYGNILATFDEADLLSQQNRIDDAEKLYWLVLSKCSIFDNKLHTLDALSLREQPPASPAGHPGAINGKIFSRDAPPADIGSKKVAPLPDEVTSAETPAKINSPQRTRPAIADVGSEIVANSKENRITDGEVEEGPISSSLMVGKEFVYKVKKHESLRMVGAKLGVAWRTVARENGLDPRKPLEPGQELAINTRRIIPKTLREGIIINIPDRTLYIFKDKKLERAVPVALGMPPYQDRGDWRTPTGRFRILSKMKNPTWHVPPSIQTEMKQNNKKVLTEVPPGDDNPLGKYALMTSLSGILIHSTDRPESIYNFASHGCIRVLPKNMAEIFPEIPVNATGEIVYEPVKLAFSDDGRVFIEVHGDIYKRFRKLDAVAKELIVRNKVEHRVDWGKVRTSLRRKSGIPEDVTLKETPREI